MKILAIDPGMRNLAWCMFCTSKDEVLSIGRKDIFNGGKVAVAPCYMHITAWCDEYASMLQEADVVLIEKQFCDRKLILSTCLNTIMTVLMCRTHGRHYQVNAMSVKRYFDIRSRTHRLNKAASVKKAKQMYPDLASAGEVKLDDIADAYLISQYAVKSGLVSDKWRRSAAIIEPTHTSAETRECRKS